ncbi:ABC transporter permease [Citricoccus sp. GCM10030269]|uniref:ABC transporter permease n=1 Tax=Citricoccus sp. GCM10030269 TaxID=3273388 RepID=UPI00361D2BBE
MLRDYPFAFALAASVVMLVINLILQPNFGPVFQLASFAPLALAAIASTPAVVAGGIDLSISAQMTLTSILFIGYLTPAGIGGWPAIPLLLGVGAVIGLINGVIVVWLRVPAIVATLASMFVLSGINLRLAPTPFNLQWSWVQMLGGSVWIIPGGLLSIGTALLIWWAFARTAFGRNTYAVGGNDATAFSSGIPVGAVRILTYVLGGVLAALGGLALAGLTSSIDASSSQAYILGAITAMALGGVRLGGGRGGVIGALCGAAVVFLVQNMLSVFHVPTTWMSLVSGSLLLFAIVLSSVLSPQRKAH